jgi:hypothetical protein
MKEDGCGSSEHEGVNLDEVDEIFCFEEDFDGTRVLMVYKVMYGAVSSSGVVVAWTLTHERRVSPIHACA